jgi:uncharacterized protein YjbI with pentapeptide repeats
MKGISLKGAVLKGINLKEADLTGADLSCVTFEDSNLVKAKFFGANFTGIVIKNSDLTEADLRCVRLIINGNIKQFLTLEGSIIEGTILPNNWKDYFQGRTSGNPILDTDPIDLIHSEL